jgi:hypothetical protein
LPDTTTVDPAVRTGQFWLVGISSMLLQSTTHLSQRQTEQHASSPCCTDSYTRDVYDFCREVKGKSSAKSAAAPATAAASQQGSAKQGSGARKADLKTLIKQSKAAEKM